MKRFAFILLALWVSLSLFTKVQAVEPFTGWDLLDVGIRGGGALLTGGENLQPQFGYAAGAEVAYRLLVPKTEGVDLGFKVGLGAAYADRRLRSTTDQWLYESQFQTGIRMVDTLHLGGSESLTGWQVEIPVMMALNARGCVINIGVIPVVGLTQKHRTQLDNPIVNTWIEDADVALRHTLVVRQDAQRIQPQIHLLVGAEAGYEWRIADRHRLGVQVYCRYDVLQEQPWSKDAFCAWQGSELVAGSLTQAFSDRLHSLDIGLRLYYAFATPHKYRRLGLRY